MDRKLAPVCHEEGPARSTGAEGRSDAALVLACQAGDQSAWRDLIVRYQRLIYSVPLRYGLSTDQADDIFQHTCLRLLESLENLRDPARVRSWLATTAQRLSLDLLHTHHIDPLDETGLERVPARDAALDEDLLRLEDQQRVRAAVDRLPARDRALVHMLFYAPEQLSYAEAARRLHLPVGSIGPLRQRCFEKLRHLL